MTRGLILKVTHDESAARARSCLGLRLLPPSGVGPQTAIVYKLGKGGIDPSKPHPAQWSGLGKRWLCDCSGFTAWALGFDRGADWLSTEGMLVDALDGPDGKDWFEPIDAPEVGCVVCYGSLYALDGNGKRVRIRPGHVGLVVAVPAEFDPALNVRDVRVVHCSSSASKKGAAITEADAGLWLRKGGRWLRYLRAA